MNLGTFNFSNPYVQQIAADRRSADAQLAADEQASLANRNEATAARQNQAAMMPRQNPRAGGTRYTRRGMWTPGGSGLDAANAKALTEARRQANYAAIDKDYAARPKGGFRVGNGQAFTIYH